MKRRIGLIVIGLLLAVALGFGLRPTPVPVQTARVRQGPLQVIVEEEGRTRIDDRYTVSAPVSAHLRRIVLKAGDVVEKGQVVAELEAPRPTLLDDRTRVELEAREAAARATLGRAEAAAALAVIERDRARRLSESGTVSDQERDQAETRAEEALAARRTAEAELASVLAARAEAAGRDGDHPVVDVMRAPVGGHVLAVHRQSAGPVAAGEPLLDLGDLDQLDIVVDVLSRDAVRIRPGTRVLLDQWGRDEPLEAEVTRVAPAGRTVVSALGVEEQRVPVEARITSPRPAWEALGDSYRVLARFIVWEDGDVLVAPAAALFRTDDGWAAFVVRDGRAEQTPVEAGRHAGLRVQILGGLAEGDEVIVHPSREVAPGVRVRPEPDSR